MLHPGKLHVLLVRCQDSIARAVAEAGHWTSVPASDAAALEQVRNATIDVVLLDLAAERAALDLARQIRAASLWRKPMFVALAEQDTEDLVSRCRSVGIDLLLVKPIQTTELTRFLNRLQSVVESYESFDPCI